MANMKPALKDMSIDELLDLKVALEKRISDVAASEMADLQHKIDRLQNVVGNVAGVTGKGRRKNAAKASTGAAKRGPKKGQKVAPKFHDPKSGNSWTGRGLTPVWLREHEEAGGNREDFAV